MCWGDLDGELLDETGDLVVVPPDGAWAQVEVGLYDACSRTNDGRVECWGAGMVNRSGEWATSIDVDVSRCSACSLTADGSIECVTDFDCLGEDDKEAGLRFQEVPEVQAVDIDIGLELGCALLADGSATCWGRGTRVPEGTFIDISVDLWMACGVRADGHVVCWSYWNDFIPDVSVLVPPAD